MGAIVNGIQSEWGALANTGGTPNLASIIGNVSNDSLVARLGAMERCVAKTDGAVLSGADNLFTIAGGPIMVTQFVGIVATGIIGAANMTIQITTTAPAGTVALSTTVAIDDDAAGTSYTFTAAAPGVLTPTTAGALANVPSYNWLCPIGTISGLGSAARAGVIAWYMTYRPLSPNCVVAAAA